MWINNPTQNRYGELLGENRAMFCAFQAPRPHFPSDPQQSSRQETEKLWDLKHVPLCFEPIDPAQTAVLIIAALEAI